MICFNELKQNYNYEDFFTNRLLLTANVVKILHMKFFIIIIFIRKIIHRAYITFPCQFPFLRYKYDKIPIEEL